MCKKFLSLILALILAFSAFAIVPISAFAAESDTAYISAAEDIATTAESSFNYSVNNNEVTITGLSGDVTDLVIPDTIAGCPVTAIADSAFAGRKSITSITVPDSVQTIGDGAFKGTSPVSVTLPFIGNSRDADKNTGVFGYIFGQVHCYYSSVPDGVTYQYPDLTGNVRYSYCYYIPKTIRSVRVTDDPRVPENAFLNCTWIESVELSDSAASVGSRAFGYCSALTEVELPDTVTSLGSYAFLNCSSLERVRLSDNISVISQNAFEGCLVLSSFNYPSALTRIDRYAFWRCCALTSAAVPSGVTEIGDHAFLDCSSMTAVSVPNSVTAIGEGAFEGTSAVTMTLPFIGGSRTAEKEEGVFGYIFGRYYCYFDNIQEGATFQYREAGDSYNYGNYYNMPKTIREVEITDDVRVPMNAFYNCTWIESVKVNSGITEFGKYAFYNCTSLASFDIPDTVVSLGDSAFHCCTSLTSIDVPDSVTTIGAYAFAECLSMTEAHLSDELTELSASMFLGCGNLETVNFPAKLTAIGAFAFSNCSSLGNSDLVIPDGVTSIGEHAFLKCGTITSITVPDSVQTIGDGAFQGTNPVSVTLPFVGRSRTAEKNEAIFGYIFGQAFCAADIPYGATFQYHDPAYLDIYNYYYHLPKTIREVTLTDAARISDSAFCNCAWIESIDIGRDIASIGDSAFEGCDSLVYICVNDPACAIGEGAVPQNVHICCAEDSAAEAYAVANGNSHGHKAAVEEAAAADCTHTGLSEGSHCSYCGEILAAQQITPALGHSYVKVDATKPDCTHTGLTDGVKCERCGEWLLEQTVIPALGHTAVTDAAVDADCIHTGLTEGSHCSVCGDILTAQETVPALGHDYKIIDAVQPDCTHDGLTGGVRCSRCGEWLIEQTVVSALGHTSVTDPAVEPDYDHTGLTEGSHCSVCGEVLIPQQIIPALTGSDGYIVGDVDGDGEVTILDATAIQRMLVSLPVESFIEAAADADGDGELTILDATAIQRSLAGLPSSDDIGKPSSTR